MERDKGSVLLMVVFVVALLTTLVMGILEMNTEEIQMMQNHVYAAEAQALAEAGLQDALSQLRTNKDWRAGYTQKAFNGGTYTVDVDSSNVESAGTTARGYTAKVEAKYGVSGTHSPYTLMISRLRINE